MLDSLEKRLHSVLPNVDFCSLRALEERSERLNVRHDVVQPPNDSLDAGVMVTVLDKGGLGYAATADLSDSGLRAAVERAVHWAHETAPAFLFDTRELRLPQPWGDYTTPVEKPWESLSLADKLDLLRRTSARLGGGNPKLVDWEVGLWRVKSDMLFITTGGGRMRQSLDMLSPMLSVTANDGSNTQVRSTSSYGDSQQGGLEVLDRTRFGARPEQLREEVLQLLAAPNCPSGKMDLVLDADQMMLQIHESIGHPLELDRILGDERNFAGTSFVTLDMFGKYRYGSDLLNVTFDPTNPQQYVSYGFDDDGLRADKTFIIEKGILKTPLGGSVSQKRAQLAGVANARASSWSRPVIDRMANLNVEPGDKTMAQLIGAVERGVLMRTNCSWSIDDSRNKFQFGCEWAQLIEDGELTQVVKNPCYRGISATFWRSLAGVGDASSRQVLGTPYCGKGEPQQIVRVGHASPACLFTSVDVFGGEG
jgi:predicted Zn-dependent protease